MKTREFIEQLRGSLSKHVLFVDENDTTIHGGYHLTELKAATFDTVDCGGQKNRWDESVVPLWVPENEESDEFMTADKFLSIYDRVSGMIALDPELRFVSSTGTRTLRPRTTMWRK
jgi:hypothetical protein